MLTARYEARVAVTPLRGRVEGRVRLHVRNVGGEAVERLHLHAPEADAYAIRVLEGGASFGGTAARPVLALEHPLSAGASHTLDLVYEARHEPRGVEQVSYLAGWLPRLAARWAADYRVAVSLPDGYRMVASGYPCGALQVADGVRAFGIVAGRTLRILEKEVGDATVTIAHRAGEEEVAEIALGAAAEALGFFRAMLGCSPFPHVSLVSGDPAREGGRPIASGMAALHGMQRAVESRYWRWLVAHEVGHQYFGERVLEGDDPGWLWLGLGLYLDLLYMRAHGLDPREHRRILRGWLEAVELGLPTALGRAPRIEHPRHNRNAVVHGRSLAFVLTLAETLGEDRFLDVLRHLVSARAGEAVGRAELEALCGHAALFARWVDDDGDPRDAAAFGCALRALRAPHT